MTGFGDRSCSETRTTVVTRRQQFRHGLTGIAGAGPAQPLPHRCRQPGFFSGRDSPGHFNGPTARRAQPGCIKRRYSGGLNPTGWRQQPDLVQENASAKLGLWISDGTGAGTHEVSVSGAPPSVWRPLGPFGGSYSASQRPWTMDHGWDPAGTHRLDLHVQPGKLRDCATVPLASRWVSPGTRSLRAICPTDIPTSLGQWRGLQGLADRAQPN